ncbi:adenosine kinase [Candidatus Marinamargulisbacteria bacterium SCGC AG-439-L15]|nr:adenosine kinase [Candidatus Marinamargulisbacteria bacterium SCGC AG-439-L15]
MINIYGIGNALVDTEIQVSDEELKNLNIEKGTMTLVDFDQLQTILAHFKDKQKKEACGGSAANTIIGATQLGTSGFYTCKVANDTRGLFYTEDLSSNHVSTKLDKEALPSGSTGICLVLITPDAQRTMCTYLGISAEFSTRNIDEEKLKSSEYLYIEGYLVSSETGLDAAVHAKEIAKKSNVKTVLTLSDPNMVRFFRDGFEKITAGGVDLIFCNEEEALTFTETNSVEEALEKLKPIAKTAAITLGENGALVYDGEKAINIAAHQVTALDTTGAGDLFAAGFLSALCHGKSYEEAGKVASFASSRVVTHFGPRLNTETLSEVQSFYKETHTLSL